MGRSSCGIDSALLMIKYSQSNWRCVLCEWLTTNGAVNQANQHRLEQDLCKDDVAKGRNWKLNAR